MTRSAVFPVFIPHAGCPHHCVFCNQYAVTAHAAAPTTDQLRARLEKWLPQQGVGEIAFYGGSFTLLPAALQQGLLGVASRFVAAGRARGIRLSTRPDGLNPEQLSRLADYPVSTVEVGCQSFSDQVLKLCARGYRAAGMTAAIERLRVVKQWRMGLQLMPGLPGAQPREALASLRAAIQLGPDFLRIYPTLVLRGTLLEEYYRSGSYRPMTLEAAVELVARLSAVATLGRVPIERIGLQGEPDWPAGQGSMCAGPYHPAFGQLVRSRQWLRVLERLLRAHGGPADIQVPKRLLSDALGHARANFTTLSALTGPVTMAASESLEEGTFRVDQTTYYWRAELAETYRKDIHDTTC